MSFAPYNPEYQYGVIISGENYAPGDVSEPAHVLMATTQAHVRQIVESAASGAPMCETGEGRACLDTPSYGRPGDTADVYVVQRRDPDFSEVLDEPGDRARHAHGYLSAEPYYRLTFGPRGGLRRDNY